MGGNGQFSYAEVAANPTTWSVAIKEFTLTGIQAVGIIVDSGASYIYIPASDLSILHTHLVSVSQSGTICQISNEYVMCDCSSTSNLDIRFPTLVMTVGGDPRVTLSLTGSSYMYYHSSSSKCRSYMRSSSQLANMNYWLMGLPFYRAYKVNHDMTTNRIGFASI